MSTEISHIFSIEHAMGILWEIKAVRLKYREGMHHRNPTKFSHWEIYMVHVDQLLVGMGNVWLILQHECPISVP